MRVPVELLKPSDEIYVEAGATVPCDCYIIEGSSLFDQSTVTGESLPIPKSVGDFLLSGTQNIGPRLLVIVHKTQDESSLAHLIDKSSRATEEKAKTHRTIDWMIRYFVLGVIVLAAASFFVALWSLHGSPLAYSINAACRRPMAILVAACPCALGLATPSAVVAGIGLIHSVPMYNQPLMIFLRNRCSP